MKLALVFLTLSLLSAGCRAENSPENSRRAVFLEKKSTSTPSGESPAYPKGAEPDFSQVSSYVTNRCGPVTFLRFVAIMSVGDSQPVNRYYFTPGSCGKPGQEIFMGFNRGQGRLSGKITATPAAGSPLAPDLGQWRLNYLEALAFARQHGGERYAKDNPGAAAVTAELSDGGAGPQWTVTYRAPEAGKPQLSVLLSAKDGAPLGP